MQLFSTEFNNGARLPDRFGGREANISPPFFWRNAPANTRSFAFICEDPDAPQQPFFHWAIYNIPADDDNLPENASVTLSNSETIAQGLNNLGVVGYTGPEPPSNSTHHYQFRLFALDTDVDMAAGISDAEVFETIQPNIIAEADITGLFGRSS